MVACDERSPSEGCEKEEPNEPPYYESCRIRVHMGKALLSLFDDVAKEPFYHYNSIISSYGYYVKPVHMVYKTRRDVKRIYYYYGKYWYKRVGKKFYYAGREKPSVVPVDPPQNPFEGASIIVEGEDLIVDCWLYDKFNEYFKGYSISREY